MADDDFYYDDESNNNFYYGDEPCEADSAAAGGEPTDMATSDAAAVEYEKVLKTILMSEVVRDIEPGMLVDLLKCQAEKIASLFLLSRQFAVLLLRRHHFTPDLANEAFMMDPEGNYDTLKVSPDIAHAGNNAFVDAATAVAGASPAQGSASSGAREADASCQLCGFADGEAEGNRVVALSNCHHFFCRDCWGDEVRQRLRSRMSLLTMRCLMAKCPQRVDVWALMELLSDPAVDRDSSNPDDEAHFSLLVQVRRSLLSEYIDNNARLNWCPNPQGCDRILFCPLTGVSAPLLTCPACHFPSCAKCKGSAHAPASCETMHEWQALVQGDGASLAHILTLTKACPKCGNRIEKSMGCNHMTCRCRYEFCWICLGDWKSHKGSNPYNCHAPMSVTVRPDETASERNSRIFFDYFVGYDAHMSSMRVDVKILSAVRDMISLVIQKQRDAFMNVLPEASVAAALTDLERAMTLARLTLAATYVEAHHIGQVRGDGAVDDMLLYRRGALMQATEALSQVVTSCVHAITHRIDLDLLQQQVAMTRKLVDAFYE